MSVAGHGHVEGAVPDIYEPGGLMDQEDGGGVGTPNWPLRVRVPGDVIIQADEQGVLKGGRESLTGVGKQGDSGVLKHSAYGRRAGPVVMVAEDSEYSQRGGQGAEGGLEASDVPGGEGDEVAAEEDEIGGRLGKGHTGRLDGGWWSQGAGVEIRGKGDPEPTSAAERLGQGDVFSPDAEGRAEELGGQDGRPGITEDLVLQVLRDPTAPGEVTGQRAF